MKKSMSNIIIRGQVVSLPTEVVTHLKLLYQNDKKQFAIVCKLYDECLPVKVAATKSVHELLDSVYEELNKASELMHFQ
jgi:hypothetical protein